MRTDQKYLYRRKIATFLMQAETSVEKTDIIYYRINDAFCDVIFEEFCCSLGTIIAQFLAVILTNVSICKIKLIIIPHT